MLLNHSTAKLYVEILGAFSGDLGVTLSVNASQYISDHTRISDCRLSSTNSTWTRVERLEPCEND